jgi:hypothetical protein
MSEAIAIPVGINSVVSEMVVDLSDDFVNDEIRIATWWYGVALRCLGLPRFDDVEVAE